MFWQCLYWNSSSFINIVHTQWGFSWHCHVTLGETQLMGINTSGTFLMGKWIGYRYVWHSSLWTPTVFKKKYILWEMPACPHATPKGKQHKQKVSHYVTTVSSSAN